MKTLREKTGCQLFYILEGAAYPNPNTKFSRVPAKNIISACFKLMVRDGVFFIQTEDQAHTARVLYSLCKTFDSCLNSSDTLDGHGVRTSECLAADMPASASASASSAVTSAAPLQFTVPDIALERVEDTDEMAVTKMWSEVPNISMVQGSLIAKMFSIADLVTGKVPPDLIKNMKTAHGRAVGGKVIGALHALRNGVRDECVRLLSGAKGVTPPTAGHIMDSVGTLTRLASYRAGAIELIMGKTKKLGPALAGRIFHLLHYNSKYSAPPPDAPLNQIARGAQVMPRLPPPPLQLAPLSLQLPPVKYEEFPEEEVLEKAPQSPVNVTAVNGNCCSSYVVDIDDSVLDEFL
jgi:ERCC4-type nuclease